MKNLIFDYLFFNFKHKSVVFLSEHERTNTTYQLELLLLIINCNTQQNKYVNINKKANKKLCKKQKMHVWIWFRVKIVQWMGAFRHYPEMGTTGVGRV